MLVPCYLFAALRAIEPWHTHGLGPCIRSEVNVNDNDNELILALHDLLERVEKERGINAAAAHTLLVDMAELAAEERGAFLEEETL